jgi:hypothetical protein
VITRPQEKGNTAYICEDMSDQDFQHWVSYGNYKASRDRHTVDETKVFFPEFGEVYEQWYQDDLKNNSI